MAQASQGLFMDICSQKPITAWALEKWQKDTHTGFIPSGITGFTFSRDCEGNPIQATAALGSGRYKGRKWVKWASRGMFWKSLFLCCLIAEFFWPPCSWSSVWKQLSCNVVSKGLTDNSLESIYFHLKCIHLAIQICIMERILESRCSLTGSVEGAVLPCSSFTFYIFD